MRSLRFRTFAWVATAGIAVAASYMISHQVASERAELDAVNSKIAEAHRDIRNLKTELGTRASMRQLERWNVDVMGLATPDANQFLNSDEMLASLNKHGVKRGTSGGPPVMVEAMRSDGMTGAPAPRTMTDVNIADEVIERRETRKKMLVDAPRDNAKISLKPESQGARVTSPADHEKRVSNLEKGVFGPAPKRPASQSNTKPAVTKPSTNQTTSSGAKKDSGVKKPAAPSARKPANLLDQVGSKPAKKKGAQ